MNSRVLISLEDVSVHFGGKPLFDGIRLHVNEHDRICLVGKNGAGKTTLMRLITGELEPDAGSRFMLPGLRIGYLAQKIEHSPDDTVRSFVLSGLSAQERSEEKHHLADQMMAPLELEAEALMDTLSGGQARRAALAQALIAAPDLLLLDEPTNHLDLTAIEWLERYLHAYRGAFICVSHDRAFLTAISQKIFWIDRGTIRTSPRGYGAFEAWAETILEQEARALQNMQKKLDAEVDWTQGGVSARRKRNVRRLRELNRLREKLKADKHSYLQHRRGIDADPLKPIPASKIVAEFKQVGKSFQRDGKKIPILQDFSLRIIRGDRIGILGRNGSGKSTFLKLLTNELQPDEGRIFRGKNSEIAYFDQNRSALNPKKSLWDTLCPNGGDYVFLGSGEEKRPVHVCGYLKQFLFDPRLARDLVGTLSGGQQNRLMLARVLAHPGNVLILDEPTNDLDMDTLDMLQELLAEYEGTLILVSHDRDFLDRTVTEILAFEGGGVVEQHIGGYTDYLNAKRAQQPAPAKAKAAAPSTVAAPEAPRPRTKMSFKLKHELEQLPGKMQALETEIISLRELLSDADLYIREPERFDTASRRLPKAQSELDMAESRWLELDELRAQEE